MAERIGFLGLGHMGMPMARNLVAAGHDVAVYDIVAAARDAAADAGLAVVETGEAAAAGRDVVITMFPNGPDVLAAYPALLAAAAPGTLFVDCSTIAVADAQAAHALAADAGFASLDAPVSGGVVGAEGATLAFMVGGDDAAFELARPILERMGRRIVHCGGDGMGQAAKVCNNMILAASQIAVAEGFVLGERLGLSHEVLYDVTANASAQCWALTTNCPVPGPVPTSPANHGFRPGFAGALMAKDLGLAERAVAQTGVQARIGMLARDIYRAYADGDGAHRDFSGVIETIRDASR